MIWYRVIIKYRLKPFLRNFTLVYTLRESFHWYPIQMKIKWKIYSKEHPDSLFIDWYSALEQTNRERERGWYTGVAYSIFAVFYLDTKGLTPTCMHAHFTGHSWSFCLISWKIKVDQQQDRVATMVEKLFIIDNYSAATPHKSLLTA